MLFIRVILYFFSYFRDQASRMVKKICTRILCSSIWMQHGRSWSRGLESICLPLRLISEVAQRRDSSSWPLCRSSQPGRWNCAVIWHCRLWIPWPDKGEIVKSFCYFVCSFPISFYIHYAIVYQPFVNPVAVGLCTVYYFFVNFIAHSSINAQSPRSEVVGFGGNFFFQIL